MDNSTRMHILYCPCNLPGYIVLPLIWQLGAELRIYFTWSYVRFSKGFRRWCIQSLLSSSVVLCTLPSIVQCWDVLAVTTSRSHCLSHLITTVWCSDWIFSWLQSSISDFATSVPRRNPLWTIEKPPCEIISCISNSWASTSRTPLLFANSLTYLTLLA